MTIMSRLFNVTLIVALMLVTNIQVTDSFGWKREDGININFNGNKQSIGNQMRQKRTTVTTTVDGKFTVQLIVNVDPVTGQVSLPQTIHGGRFRTVPNARRCQGRQCNYSLAFQTVSPPVTPVFIDLKRINNSQSKTTADEKAIQNNKRVTAAPRYLHPKQVSTVRYPLPTQTRKQIVNRTRIVNSEWARRTSARKPSVLTTTARNLVNSRNELLLPKTRNNSESRPKETENVLHQKKNETDSYSNRKSPSTSNHSDKVGKVVQSSQFNESIFTDAEKPVTAHSGDIVSHTTSPQPLTGHSGEEGGILNPEQSYGFNRQIQANQTTEIASGSPTQTPGHCEKLDCLPWERRANFEVQINPRTMQIVNIRVPTITAKSKPVRPSHEYEDLGNTKTSLPPTNSTRKDDEFPWQHRDGFKLQIKNPKTEQVVNIRAQQNASNQPTVSPHEEYENSSAEKPVSPASGALKQTTTYTKHEELPWLQRDHHQVQIDPKTGQVINIRTQTKPKQNLTQHYENPENPSTQRPAVRTQMVTREARLPVPFYYRKQITSQSSNPDSVTYNLTKESGAVIHGRMETTTNSYSTPQPRKESNEFPWQQRDGFEVQINPITKEVVDVRIVQNSRHVPLTMHDEQATVPNNLTQSTTEPGLVFETSRRPDVFLRQHEVDDKVQTSEKTTTTGDVKTQSSPTPITLDVQTGNPKGDGDEASSPTPDLNSQVPTPEVGDFSVPVTGIPMTTTTLVPMAELSEEDFPWEQRDDYEVQINPKTKQIVNIRLQTTTTHNPVSKSTRFDKANDPDGDGVRSQTRDRPVDISTFVKLDDERDDVSVERDPNSKIQTLIVPRRKDVGGHAFRIGGELPDETRSRIAVLAVPIQKDGAIRKMVNSPARTTQIVRKPIFSHSDTDGLLYFRYDDLLEQLEPFNRDAKFVFIDENSWIASNRPGRGRDSPYFYYSHSSSFLMNVSCYPVLLVACLVFFIS